MKRSKPTIDPARFSKDFIAANPGLLGMPCVASRMPANAPLGVSEGKDSGKAGKCRRMNATEAEFAMILEAQKRNGEIKSYKYEGLRLKWGENPKTGEAMFYKPDFVVFGKAFKANNEPEGEIPKYIFADTITLIEVKGAKIWDRDLVRFRGCRAEWPQFEFQLWQKQKGVGWVRLE